MEEPMRPSSKWILAVLAAVIAATAAPATQGGNVANLEGYKKQVAADIDGMYDLAQQMVDSVFSFGELGFQEFETQRYLTASSKRKASQSRKGSRVFQRPGPQGSDRASRSLRSGPTWTAFRKHRRNLVSRTGRP